MKTALVCGGGGFIGGHLARRLKDEGFWVRVADIKSAPEFWKTEDICDEYVSADLRQASAVEGVMKPPSAEQFNEVYQLAADMGGAGYIFTGENDANVMHNSALINLNVLESAVQTRPRRLFYSSSACIYPEQNQLDPNNPNCEESSAYPANPDSEYGWEKLFSERLFLAFQRNYGLDVRIARFHNVFGPRGTWRGGKEKAPAAMCRKVAESDGVVEVWGDGLQTRSFLYIDECVEAVLRFMRQKSFAGPVNIGSEEMVSINQLAQLAIEISGKTIAIENLAGAEFKAKYGFACPTGVRGRCSHNRLFRQHMNWEPTAPLREGLRNTYAWIAEQIACQSSPSHV